jgi:xanthosine utilization system XapX-like protein
MTEKGTHVASHSHPRWFIPLLLIIIALVAVLGSSYGTTVYFLAHPQITTLTDSATVTNTVTSATTQVQTVTSLLTTYPTALCEYQNCYPVYGGSAKSTIYGYLAPNQGGTCVYFQAQLMSVEPTVVYGVTYALYNLPSSYPTGLVTVVGYLNNNYNTCGGSEGLWVLSISH